MKNKGKKNEGKKFEEDFIKSVPEQWFDYRLNDSASSWQGGEKARFTPTNICDFIVYTKKDLWLLELKSHKGVSFPLTPKYNPKGKLTDYGVIKVKQLDGLVKANEKGILAGFVFNFRDKEETYFLMAEKVKEFIDSESRKSIPIDYIKDNGTLIKQTKKISRYTYILEFMGDIG